MLRDVRTLRWSEEVHCVQCRSTAVTKQGRDPTQPERQKYRFALVAKLRRLPKAKFEQILADVEFFLRKKQSIQEVPRWLHGRIRNDVASAACSPDPQPAASSQTAQRQAERERQAQEQTHQTLERVKQQLAQQSQETLVEEPQRNKRAEPVKRWERSKLQELQKLLGKTKWSR